MRTKIYGIKNCNTMKKAFALFEEAGKPYDFVDYKKQSPDAELLGSFIDALGLEQVVNKRGTTYRKLDEAVKSAVENRDTAIPVLREKSSMIKRPIIRFEDGSLQAGLDEEKIKAKL
ncbi:Spx/MgsR family RNA polymerase-binding regulatory protein [Cyclobacterium xiamenense]|jgi:Spx/MgsR family transcriptional regulator|uniref:Spx/MgsR family RNA polymerase-binding regulatory protein n=1 Tax=Cyclobacterium xiamenense TaxID=1297121 RepID=UPI0035D062DE